MFDSVLGRATATQGRLGTGAVLSLVAHAAIAGALLWHATRPRVEQHKKDVEVTFFAPAPPPPPPPPPPPAGGGAKVKEPPKVERIERPKPVKTPDTIYDMPEKPKAKRPEPEPEPEPVKAEAPEQPGGVEGGVEGGVQGGTVGGTLGGEIGGKLGGTLGGKLGSPAPPQNVVLPFGAGMNRPSRVAGREPQYTREALAARVEGLAIVKCVIKVDGTLSGCRMIKSIPHMDREILAALATHRYTPVMYQGRPVSVDYVFNIRLKLP
ncbi:biopolymer transporter TonB [Sorangium cellulosum]|uniref:Biopolymer transporter TonB n=1 Tax=Sorangium cellulosum TaxID=56 RepID=A0A4P2Q3J7_SORCE|nr:energy transducer TonB [Sorangium cellulosum]AUX23473.1 biopolymer transporter TonB [Sorangium cellulosum]